MSAAWLDFCIRLDGPREKTGYAGVTGRRADEVEGEVDHSTEGPLSAALGELNKLERQASWPFTVPKAGPPLQHYPIFGDYSVTWHAGLPGDRRTDTSLIGNLTLIGVEHVDWPDNVLNANQLYWSAELTKAFRRLCPRIAARPPALRVNLWEHNWLSATSCPSGLIPWAKKLALLQEEDDMGMTPAEAADFTALKQRVAELVGEDLTDDVQELAFKKRLDFLANVAQLQGKVGEAAALTAALLSHGPLASRLEGLARAEKALNDALKMITAPLTDPTTPGMRAELQSGKY